MFYKKDKTRKKNKLEVHEKKVIKNRGKRVVFGFIGHSGYHNINKFC